MTSNPQLSVVICTHNPRRDYLEQALVALSQQSLSPQHWDLVLVDNGSVENLADGISLPVGLKGRWVRENHLGLTHARLRGITETSGDLIVFVDDDNILDTRYLEKTCEIATARPYIGAFGGNIIGSFEVPPPKFTEGLLNWLAILHVDRDVWGNSTSLDPMPVGAGLCIRRSVAQRYTADLEIQSYRKKLDRRGAELTSGGDNDLLFTAIEMGLGVGIFVDLQLNHLISKERLTQDYFIRMAEAMAFSQVLRARMGRAKPIPARHWRRKLLDLVKTPLLAPFQRKLLGASRKGAHRALQIDLPPTRSLQP